MRHLKTIVPAFALAIGGKTPVPAFGEERPRRSPQPPRAGRTRAGATCRSVRPTWALPRQMSCDTGTAAFALSAPRPRGPTPCVGTAMGRAPLRAGASTTQRRRALRAERVLRGSAHDPCASACSITAPVSATNCPSSLASRTMKIAGEWTECDVVQPGTACWITGGEWSRYISRSAMKYPDRRGFHPVIR